MRFNSRLLACRLWVCKTALVARLLACGAMAFVSLICLQWRDRSRFTLDSVTAMVGILMKRDD